MKINNKFTKIFFIFLFFIFIFLFFNINDCFAFEIEELENLTDYSFIGFDNTAITFKEDYKHYLSNGKSYLYFSSVPKTDDPNLYGYFLVSSEIDGTFRYDFINKRYYFVKNDGSFGDLTLFKLYFYTSENNSISSKWGKFDFIDSVRTTINTDTNYIYFQTIDLIGNSDYLCSSTNNVLDYNNPETVLFQKVPPTPATPTQNYTLYIDDCNFMKRFKFEFKVPLIKDDTKVFCFLEDYTRNSYDSVTGTFKFYTVSTPEGYDYTDYKNYMYYDSEDKKLYLPAGCIIERYSCTATNGDLFDLTLEASYISIRDKNYLFHNVKNENSLNTIIHDSITIDNPWSYGEFNEDTLFPTSLTLIDLDCSEFLSAFGKAVCNVPVIR